MTRVSPGPALLALFLLRGAPRAASLLAVVLALLTPGLARAQPQLSARADTDEVEVGERFSVELKAMVERGEPMPSDPQLRVPGDLTVVSGPSISTQMSTRIIGGSISSQVGIGASWQIVANKPGHYVIPSPTITWDGKRLGASSIPITVVPATGRPRRTQNNPFLLPGGPMGGFPWPFGGRSPFDDDERYDEPQDEAPDLALPEEPDAVAFLRAVTDKTAAVVGEQVSVSFYLYYRDSVEMSEPHAAPAADFLRHPLLDDARNEKPRFTRVGGRRYAARLVDRLALFPLKAGELHTGNLQARLTGRRIGARVLRESNDLVIRVSEPPRAGRPPGYTLGDVGKFTLTAAVQPRQIEQGGSVAVTVRIAGTGNFPQSLRIPERTGLDWLDPEKRESLETRGGVIGGFRSFGYVVRIKESGEVDLGAIELPYWDPEQKRYQVERAELGRVEVTPTLPAIAPGQASAAAAAPSAPQAEPFTAMPGPRLALGAYARPAAAPPLEGAPFWLLLASPPLLVSLFGAGARVVRDARARRAAGASSPARLAAVAQREAEEAAARGDLKETAAAVDRAMHRAIEAATGLRSRGVLLDALPAELSRQGVPTPLARRINDVLAACEAIRFEPAGQERRERAASDLVRRARDVTTELSRWKPS